MVYYSQILFHKLKVKVWYIWCHLILSIVLLRSLITSNSSGKKLILLSLKDITIWGLIFFKYLSYNNKNLVFFFFIFHCSGVTSSWFPDGLVHYIDKAGRSATTNWQNSRWHRSYWCLIKWCRNYKVVFSKIFQLNVWVNWIVNYGHSFLTNKTKQKCSLMYY